MTRFADPARCPDCRATLTPGSFTCPACRLDLSGDLGRRLFTLLTEADRVLVQMRARSTAPVAPTTPEPARVPVGAALPPPPLQPPGGPAPFPAPPGPPPAVRGATVPQVLLGLGAL